MNRPASHSHQAAVRGAASVTLFALALTLAPLASANTFTVTNTDDTGAGSLRQAITDANGNGGLDTIAFNIDTSTDGGCTGTPKVCTIQPATALPTITGPVFIDGYTQPGASMNTLDVGDDAVIVIEIDANGLGGSVLKLSGTGAAASGAIGSTIRGLALTNFTYGIEINNGADNVTIAGNFIGTDATGTSGNSPPATIDIYVFGGAGSADGVVIGGTAPADRNIVAAAGNGIDMETVTNCTIQGNYVGLDKSGGVRLTTMNAVIVRGTQFGMSSGCLVGGSATGAGNVIVGGTSGLTLGLDHNNVVQGNLIGTDATGTVGLGQYYGLVFGGTDDQIGGTGFGEGNLISGNAADGIIASGSPTGTRIEGNKIGTDITGTQPLGNGWCGIDGGGLASNSSVAVGGMDPGAGNVIAFNGANGVTVTGASNTGWAIQGNSIYANGVLGISLTGNCQYAVGAPVANDAGDGDSGANNLQNYPVVTTVTTGPKTTVHVSGTLNSAADSMFHIEFFANASCDAKGNGEGKIFIGSTDVTTTGNDASFGPLDCTVPAERHVITATATDAGGNTSEFSECATQDSIFTDGLEEDDLPSPVCTPLAM